MVIARLQKSNDTVTEMRKFGPVPMCSGGEAWDADYILPLSHYSRNAPRFHNVGHIFQIAKVPSGVCKIRPAFLLDSATFLAIANARGNVQGGSCVSGRYFIFSKIRELVKNPIQQTYERTNTIR